MTAGDAVTGKNSDEGKDKRKGASALMDSSLLFHGWGFSGGVAFWG